MLKLIILVSIQNFVIGKILLPPHDDDDDYDDVTLFNDVMRDLFNNCRNEFGTIGIWGNKSNFLKDGEMDVVLINDNWPFRILLPKIKFFVIFIDDFLRHFPFIEIRDDDDRRELIILFLFDRGGYWKNNLTGLIPNIGGEDYTMENTLFYYFYVSNERQIEILTVNSYADFAPANWVKVQDIFANIYSSDFHFRIYKTLYISPDNTTDHEFCKNIFFDRTKHLFGYTIIVGNILLANNTDKLNFKSKKSVNQLINRNTPLSETVELLGEESGNYTLWLMESLNISLSITIELIDLSDEIDIGTVLQYLVLDAADLTLQPLPQSVFRKDYDLICVSHPIQYFHDVIVTLNRGLMSPLEKMFEFYGWVTIIATIIILSITFLVIYQSNNHKISFALFECLRLIINYKIDTRMDNDNIRVFFSVIFLYFLIIQATFSGHLAAFLTKPVHRKNVETLDDLKDPHYQRIFVPLRILYSHFIEEELLKQKLLSTENRWSIDDNHMALIDHEERLNPLILEHNLYKSKSYLKFDFSVLAMRGNWGLRERVNKVIMRWTESHIVTRWHENKNQPIRRKFEIIQDRAKNYYRPVEFRDLYFAFIFLAFGLISGVLCFVIELFDKIILAVGKKIIQFQVLTFKIIIFNFHRLLNSRSAVYLSSYLFKIVGIFYDAFQITKVNFIILINEYHIFFSVIHFFILKLVSV